ncbi:MAG: ABC transporter ATP-binding protein [Pseudanabaenaceae cyanobacterium bins.39]|nr:ABC transporter ATP-binding protein [Pseudanabaenaceae cyanobacterium bins.39]
MAPVRLCGVTKSFNGNTVLHNIDLEIYDREFMVLVGPSGCGKSTLLRLMAGLEEISDGAIYLGDRQVNHLPPKARDMAMVFQSYALYPHMTVYNNIAFGLRKQRSRQFGWWQAMQASHREVIDQRVRQVAQSLQIEHLLHRKPKELSGGQKQRVALGRAIARNPQVFLMDEPLSNLDAQLRSDTRSQIVQLQKHLQVTTVYVTHDQIEAMTMGDRITVLNQGKVQQVDTPLNIYRRPANQFVAGFMGAPPMNFLPMQIDHQGNLIDHCLTQPIAIGNASIGAVGTDRQITLGIRPEDLQPVIADHAHFVGIVELVEALGSETIILLKVGGLEVRARVSADISLERHWQIGDRSFWRFDLQKLYAFDQFTGITLHHPYSQS